MPSTETPPKSRAQSHTTALREGGTYKQSVISILADPHLDSPYLHPGKTMQRRIWQHRQVIQVRFSWLHNYAVIVMGEVRIVVVFVAIVEVLSV